MVLANSQGIFNLVDTNGRRSDLINGYSIYSNALYELGIVDKGKYHSTQKFTSYPTSLNQYKFYQKVFNRSEVFKCNSKYSAFLDTLYHNKKFQTAFFNLKDKKWMNKYYNQEMSYLNRGIEDHSRHYINSLKNMGLSNSSNLLTENGKVFVKNNILKRDYLERRMFQNNLKNPNLMILRQALKLRVFENSDKNQKKENRDFYRPIQFAMYLLLKQNNKPIPKSQLTKMLQNITPNTIKKFSPQQLVDIYQKEGCDKFLESVNMTNYTQKAKQALIQYHNSKIDKETFFKYFKNGNSRKISESYWEFYNSLYNVIKTKKSKYVRKLMNIHQKYKKNLKSAFGYSKMVLKNKQTSDFSSLLKNNPNFNLLHVNLNRFNEEFYKLFLGSKRNDKVKESLTGVYQIMDASNLFAVDNHNRIYLNYFDVFVQSPIIQNIEKSIFDKGKPIDWEGNDYSPFFHQTSLSKILRVSNEQVDIILKKAIAGKDNVNNISDLHDYYTNQEVYRFQQFILNRFPKQRLFNILSLFSHRNSSVDKKIKKNIFNTSRSVKADIPTMFEYIVGIAWYYLNDDDTPYDLYHSFGLSMGADYLPLTHAPGGNGDIMVRYHNLDLMIEVTLMNKQAQKQGESEPVLRHSINLNVESNKPNQLTLFVANELDYNTITTWRNMASVPMKESRGQKRFTKGKVRIMPLKSEEIVNFSCKKFSSKKFINDVFRSFRNISYGDNTWRESIVNNFINN